MNDRFFAAAVKNALNSSISELDLAKQCFLRNPDKDFSRKRLFDFPSLIRLSLQIEGSALQNEILKFFSFQDCCPTSSALCQQRDKVLPDAFAFLFRSFTDKLLSLDHLRLFRDKYLLLAVDGSDLNIPFNPEDPDTLFQVLDKHPYNKTHLTVLFDLNNGIYHDAFLTPLRIVDERSAFHTMVGRFPKGSDAIFIADRGFEGFNTFAHLIHSGQRFLIRMKDISSSGILANFCQPDPEFDSSFSTILTRKQTSDIRNNKDTYTILTNKSSFDFLSDNTLFYPISFRVLRFQVRPGVYECIGTNLDPKEFSMMDIKQLYHLRWGVETSFRDLKYTIDLVHLHARKRPCVEQEIWSRLIVYNFCESITRHISSTRQSVRDIGMHRKWAYKINFATAVCICKAYLKGDSEIDVCRLIGRFLIPIRPSRLSVRNIAVQSARTFLYRAA